MPASPLESVDGCLGLSLSHLPPPPSTASRQVLPPALSTPVSWAPSIMPGLLRPGLGLLLALTGPSWEQERNGQRDPSVPILLHPHSKQFPLYKVDSCQEFPRASATLPILPSPAAQALNGLLGGGVGLVRGARVREREKGRTER